MVSTLIASGCGQTTSGVGGAEESKPFDGISASETIRLVGTEPFWGGTVSDKVLLYSTPENQAGVSVPVNRFAGLNGLAFSGKMAGRTLDLLITRAPCSDGMSDRSYPFVATMQIGEERRQGCAWTERTPYSKTGPGN